MSHQETTDTKNGHTSENGQTAPAVNLIPWEKWMSDMNLSRATAYRYRMRGMIAAINIFGRLYVSRDEVARFEERAEAGEFALKRWTQPPTSKRLATA